MKTGDKKGWRDPKERNNRRFGLKEVLVRIAVALIALTIVWAVIAAGMLAYYYKIYRPKRQEEIQEHYLKYLTRPLDPGDTGQAKDGEGNSR